jgi:membrane fusion protein, heavy metal efflux system
MKLGKRLAALLCGCCLCPGLGAAPSVPLAALGDLQLAFAPLQEVTEVPGPPVWAEVGHRPGASFTLYAPRRVQQLEYLVENGQAVAANAPIAVMRGPEIHHWQVEFELLGEQYTLARERYQRNLPLYQSKSLAEDRWLEILGRWQDLQLEYEHMRHFSELLSAAPDGEEDSLLLHAPVAGYISYGERGAAPMEGEAIASFLARDALRVRALVPAAGRQQLTGLSVMGERLGVHSAGSRVEGFMVEVWSAPLSPDSPRLPGESVSAIPLYRPDPGAGRIYRVPAAALLEYAQGSYLLLRDGDRLQLQAVEPLTAVDGDYLLQADAELAGGEVLVTSVSAVQGILLGLGGE